MIEMDEAARIRIEAAAFRKLVAHLGANPDVQNIDLMNLAGFCRNSLADWWREAAANEGMAVSKDASREVIYGMPYADWKALWQKEASAEQAAAFAARSGDHGA